MKILDYDGNEIPWDIFIEAGQMLEKDIQDEIDKVKDEEI